MMVSLTLVIKAEEGEGGAHTLSPRFSTNLFSALPLAESTYMLSYQEPHGEHVEMTNPIFMNEV